MLSALSAGPYMPDMPMQPRPSGETTGPVEPSERAITVSSSVFRCATGRDTRRPEAALNRGAAQSINPAVTVVSDHPLHESPTARLERTILAAGAAIRRQRLGDLQKIYDELSHWDDRQRAFQARRRLVELAFAAQGTLPA